MKSSPSEVTRCMTVPSGAPVAHRDRARAPARERSTGEVGQTTVVMALVMATFLLGFVALGFDVNNLFRERRMAQAAADAAAIAAAEESATPPTGTISASQQAAANAMATLNGFNTSAATNRASVALSPMPSSGNYSGSTSYVQAVVSQPISTPFMSLLSHKTTVTISARAVAGVGQNSPTCVCLEGTSGIDLNLTNNARYSPSSCGTTVNSSSSNAVWVQGGAILGGTSLGIFSSTWTQTGNSPANVANGGSISVPASKIVTNLSSTCSPTIPAGPSYNSSKCSVDPLGSYPNGGSSYSVGPGSSHSNTQGGTLVCYNSLTIGSNSDTVNLNAGTYVINGGQLHFLSGTQTGGAGVLFYLVNGASLVIDNGANTNLTAQSSGAYSGILVLEDPNTDSAAVTVEGGASAVFNGAIYAPTAGVTLGNGSNSTIDAAIVAQTLTMTGGTTLASTAQANMGSMNTSVAKVTE